MGQKILIEDIDRIKERLQEKGVKIGIPTERFSDVYGLEDQKDKFFTLVALPLLKPEIFKEIGVVQKISITHPNNKNVGLCHFIRALAGEYSLNLITLDGRELHEFELDEASSFISDIKSVLVTTQPSILFIRNMCDLDNSNLKSCRVVKLAFSYFQADATFVYIIVACGHNIYHEDTKSVIFKQIFFPGNNHEVLRGILDNRHQISSAGITDGLLNSILRDYTFEQFEEIIRLSLVCQKLRVFNRQAFVAIDDECDNDSKKGSTANLKRTFKCQIEEQTFPEINEDDVNYAIKIYSAGGFTEIYN